MSSSDEKAAVPVPLPKALDGVFARVGPNPDLASRFSGDYHWFDGSGHVHAVRISKEGKAISYCNRWVETSRLRQERRAGVPLFTNFGDYRGWFAALHLLVGGARRLLGAKDSSKGDGTANTALVFHAKKLLALHEGDLPYVLRVACDGVLETVGRLSDFSSKKEEKKGNEKEEEEKTTMGHPFTAHPKVDPSTGELFGIGYNVESKPYLYYFGLDSEGGLKFDVPIDTPVRGEKKFFLSSSLFSTKKPPAKKKAHSWGKKKNLKKKHSTRRCSTTWPSPRTTPSSSTRP